MTALSFKIGSLMVPVPGPLWRFVVGRQAAATVRAVSFMTPEHHRVRNLCVTRLGTATAPLSPRQIADELELPLPRTDALLDELERHLLFVWRNDEGDVTWAYPVTVDQTPHHLAFESGERMTAA